MKHTRRVEKLEEKLGTKRHPYQVVFLKEGETEVDPETLARMSECDFLLIVRE